ncbi:MAG: hypothetical protein JW748_12290 [Anaerolineales bacterium]|nr:hypothetical protein [Anaerolineales bacterium]
MRKAIAAHPVLTCSLAVLIFSVVCVLGCLIWGAVTVLPSFANTLSVAGGSDSDLIGQVGGGVSACAVRQKTVFATVGFRLKSFDVSNPNQLMEIGESDLLPSATELLVSVDHYLLSSNVVDAAFLIDVSDPAHPRYAGHWSDLIDSPKFLEVDGQYGFSIGLYGTLTVYDLQDPLKPKSISALDLEDRNNILVSGFAYQNGYGYASGTEDLFVLDLRDPTKKTIAITATMHLPDKAVSLAAFGSRLFINGNNSLMVVDVSDPERPALVQGRNGFPDGYDVFIGGKYLFLTTFPNKDSRFAYLYWKDVSSDLNSAAPEKFSFPAPVLSVQRWNAAGGLGCFIQTYWYLSETSPADFLQVVDLSGPDGPVLGAAYHPEGLSGHRVAVDSSIAYLLSDDGELVWVDVGDPTLPRILGRRKLGDEANSLVLDNGLVFATSDRQLNILQLGADRGLNLLAALSTDADAIGLAVGNGRAYVSEGYRVDVFAVDDPSRPTKLTFIDAGVPAGELALGDRVLAMGSGENGAVFFPLDADGKPTGASREPALLAEESNVVFAGTAAYFVGYSDAGDLSLATQGIDPHTMQDASVLVYDCVDPAKPRFSRSFSLQNFAGRILLQGDNLFLAASGNGLKVRKTEGKTLLPGWWLSRNLNVVDVAADEDYIYLADAMQGLIILNNWLLHPLANVSDGKR